MTKAELMENYTAEQIAEMVVEKYNRLRSEEKPFGYHYDLGNGRAIKFIGFEGHEAEIYRKAFEDAKKERDCQIAEYQKKIDDLEHDLKTAGEKIQDLAGENMKLQCERNDYKTKAEFLEVERMRVKKNEFADFLPTEPIKVADMLINAEGEYEHNPIAKAFCGTDKGTYRIFDVPELKQIAEHLLIYCNHNKEEE